MLDMRIRLPELIAEYKPDMRPTGYALAQASGGKINGSLARRLMDQKRPLRQVHFSTLDALCDVLGCPPSALLTRDETPAPRTPAAPAVHKRKPKAKAR